VADSHYRDAAGARGRAGFFERDESGHGVHRGYDCLGSATAPPAQIAVASQRPPAAVPVLEAARGVRSGHRASETASKSSRPQDRGPAKCLGVAGCGRRVRRSWGPDHWPCVRWRAGSKWFFSGEDASSWSSAACGRRRPPSRFIPGNPLAMRAVPAMSVRENLH